MTRRQQPNIRRARGITPDTVRALLGMIHAGTDTAYLPLERIKLADQVKGSGPVDSADVPASLRPDCTSGEPAPAETEIRGRSGFFIVDEFAAFASATSLDPCDVPACMRPDCDTTSTTIGVDLAAHPDQSALVEHRDQLIEAIHALGANPIPCLAPELKLRFITPSVPQSEPPRGCDDGARSSSTGPEPTAPSLPADAEEPADAAADAEECRAGGEPDRAGRAGADQSGSAGRTNGGDRTPRVVSRPARPGAATRAARTDAKRDAAAPELKADRLAMIRKIAGQLDLRPATAPIAPVQARPIAAPRNPRKPAPVLRADPIAERRELLDAAIRFLKARCILVDCTDRSAMVRRYRVSGKRDTMLAEHVIEHARSLGMGEQG